MTKEILKTKIRTRKGVLQSLTAIYLTINFISYHKNQDLLFLYFLTSLNLTPDISNLRMSHYTQQLFLKRLKKILDYQFIVSVQGFYCCIAT